MGNIYDINGSALNISEFVDARDFGCTGDGVTDNRAPLSTALSYCASHNTGLYIPEGVYNLDWNEGESRNAIEIVNMNNITIRGAGVGRTILRTDPALLGRLYMIHVYFSNNIHISDMTIDGGIRDDTRASVPESNESHGIRFGGCTNIILENLAIMQTAGYGIGQQRSSSQHVIIRNVTIADTGLDCIDFKNFDDANADIVIENVSVFRPGRQVGSTAQTGIDIRCKGAHINNIYAELTSGDNSGIRARSSTELQGTGGTYMNIANVTIIGATGNTGIGISADTHGVKISNTHVEKTGYGLYITNKDNDDFTGTLPTYAHITNTTISGCYTRGAYIMGSGNCVVNTSFEGMTTAVEINKGAYQNFVGCAFVDCGTALSIGSSAEAVNLIGCVGENVTTTASGKTSALNRTNCAGLG